MPLQDTVVLDGELSLILTESAECELVIPETGESGVITVVRESDLPIYAGPTEITPTEETQVLATRDKAVLSNITVNAIPSNYGRLIWNGNKLTVY